VEEFGGVLGSYCDGVFFTEDLLPETRLRDKPFRVEISRQNSNLLRIRERLAKKVLAAGGNALVGFQYGQRSHPVWKQVLTFKWDTESWHGEGYPAILEDSP
jgi:hypothetical protein